MKTNAEADFAASSPETLSLQVISKLFFISSFLFFSSLSSFYLLFILFDSSNIATAAKANISLVGENATAPIDQQGYSQMLRFASIAKRHHPLLPPSLSHVLHHHPPSTQQPLLRSPLLPVCEPDAQERRHAWKEQLVARSVWTGWCCWTWNHSVELQKKRRKPLEWFK